MHHKLKLHPLSTHLQAFDAVGQRGGVCAALAACGVDVALDGVVRLVAGLVQRAQVHPGGGVAVVQLHGANVGLQCVHGLVLLLVQHPEGAGGEGKERGCRGAGRYEQQMQKKRGPGGNESCLMKRIEKRDVHNVFF